MPPQFGEGATTMMENPTASEATGEEEEELDSGLSVKEESKLLWDEINNDDTEESETASKEENTSDMNTSEGTALEGEGDVNIDTSESNVNNPKPAATTAPPPTFGSRFASFNQRMREQWQTRQARLREEAAEPSPAVITSQPNGDGITTTAQALTISDAEKQFLRPSTISVTVLKATRDSKWGFGIVQHETEPDSVIIKAVVNDHGCLLKDAPFQEDDILKSVNNQKCIKSETTIQELVKLEGNSQVTLTAETPNGNPQLVQAFVRKPTKDSLIGIGFYNTTHAGGQTILQINYLDPVGLLAHSALSQGDLILSINDTPCSQMDANEAAKLILTSAETVTIAALRPKNETTGELAQRWMRQAKRAGVAIGGGAMVGVGLIFIPTLPPPFGEVLIVGGVSVLGTEFEAPKRVMKSARDRLESAVGRAEDLDEANENGESKEGQGKEQEGGEPSDASGEAEESPISGSEEGTDKAKPPTKTMGYRFKNFGRNYVLPFLDQVVGDRDPEGDNAEVTTPVLAIPDSDDEEEESSSAQVPPDDVVDTSEEGQVHSNTSNTSNKDGINKSELQIPESDQENSTPEPNHVVTASEANDDSTLSDKVPE